MILRTYGFQNLFILTNLDLLLISLCFFNLNFHDLTAKFNAAWHGRFDETMYLE